MSTWLRCRPRHTTVCLRPPPCPALIGIVSFYPSIYLDCYNVSDSISGNPRITNEVTHEFMQFEGVGFMINDVIVIDTNYGKMRATLHRIGLKVNMLRYLTDDSTWIKLATGINTLSYTDIHKNYDNTTITVEYTPLFGGV